VDSVFHKLAKYTLISRAQARNKVNHDWIAVFALLSVFARNHLSGKENVTREDAKQRKEANSDHYAVDKTGLTRCSLRFRFNLLETLFHVSLVGVKVGNLLME